VYIYIYINLYVYILIEVLVTRISFMSYDISRQNLYKRDIWS